MSVPTFQPVKTSNYYVCVKIGHNTKMVFEEKFQTISGKVVGFNSWTKEVGTKLDIKVGNHFLQTVSNPKIQGITYDQMQTFNLAHSTQVTNKLKTRNNTLKCIAGSTWGKEQDTLFTVFKVNNRPIINYSVHIWSAQLSLTNYGQTYNLAKMHH